MTLGKAEVDSIGCMQVTNYSTDVCFHNDLIVPFGTGGLVFSGQSVDVYR